MKLRLLLTTIMFFISFNVWSIPLFDKKFTDINGQNYTFNAQDYVGVEKTFVMFWGSWCKDCKGKLITTLPNFSKQGKIKVLTINMDANTKRALKYVNENKLLVPVLRELDNDKSFSEKFKVRAVPHWAVLARKDTTVDEWTIVDNAPAFDEVRVAKALEISAL